MARLARSSIIRRPNKQMHTHARPHTTSSIFMMLHTVSVAREMELVETSSGWTTFSSLMSQMVPWNASWCVGEWFAKCECDQLSRRCPHAADYTGRGEAEEVCVRAPMCSFLRD